MYGRSKRINKENTPINSHTNFRRGMKFVTISMDYCLLQSDALKFFLGVRLHGVGTLPNFNSFNVNHQIFQRNRKAHLSNCPENFFTRFVTLV